MLADSLSEVDVRSGGGFSLTRTGSTSEHVLRETAAP